MDKLSAAAGDCFDWGVVLDGRGQEQRWLCGYIVLKGRR